MIQSVNSCICLPFGFSALSDNSNRNIKKIFKMESETLRRMVHQSKAIVLDIEGTITSIDFIRENVFPYAESHLEDFIMKNWVEVKEIGLLLQQQSLDSKGSSKDLIPLPQVPSTENIEEIENFQRALVSYVKQRMSNNRNDPAMKQIQGLVLRNAFKSGDIIAEIYPDTVKALETWSLENKQVFTYSTGIRDVQVEFFKNTNFGNKAQFIKAYFDTSIGSKLESDGYKFICDFAKVAPSEVVFFSDRPLEIAAAKKCGLRTIVVVRESRFSMIKEEEEFLGHEDGKISSFIEIL